MIEKKYIVHIVQPVSKSTIGGADMHVLDLVSLQKNRDDITPIVCIRWNDNLKKRFDALGVLCFCGQQFDFDFQYILWIGKLLRTYNVSIFHSHGYDANFQYVALRLLNYAFFAEAKLVITSHGWIENTPSLWLKTRLDFLCHRFADAHIVCAHRNLQRLSDNSLHYCVLNGIVPFTCTRTVSNYVRVGFVGRLSKEKRPDIFVKTAKLITDEFPVVFYIYGEGAEEEYIRSMIKSYGLCEKVYLKGQYIDRTMIFSNIDILILPSDTESTPRVAIEASLCEIPVVATDVGDVSRIVVNNKTGYVVKKGDLQSITMCTHKLISDVSLRNTMGKNGKEHAMKYFSAQSMEQSIYDIYKKII